MKLERWQKSPPNIDKLKQKEIALSFKISLFIPFIQSQKEEFVYFVCFGMKKKSVKEDFLY